MMNLWHNDSWQHVKTLWCCIVLHIVWANYWSFTNVVFSCRWMQEMLMELRLFVTLVTMAVFPVSNCCWNMGQMWIRLLASLHPCMRQSSEVSLWKPFKQGLTKTFMSCGPQVHQLRGSGGPTIFLGVLKTKTLVNLETIFWESWTTGPLSVSNAALKPSRCIKASFDIPVN